MSRAAKSQRVRRARDLAAGLIGLALLASGCGGGDHGEERSSSSTASTTSSPPEVANPQRTKGTGRSRSQGRPPHAGRGKRATSSDRNEAPAFGAAQFETPGGDNSIQRFGHEASRQQVAAAGAALHGYLNSRFGKHWQRTCSFMSSSAGAALVKYAEAVSGEQGNRLPGCAAAARVLFASMPETLARGDALADVRALRLHDGKSYLLFYGPEREAFFVPMRREHGQWKVAAPAPSPLP
jgi:hypothetical protein